MKKILINISKKTMTSAMLFAFLFNANFLVIQSAYAQYDYDGSYTTDYNYDNNNYDNYTNNNVDTVSYGCEYYGSCGNTYTNDYNYDNTYTTDYNYDNNNYDNYTNNNVDTVSYGCEYYGSCGNTYTNDPIYTGGPSYTDPVYTYPTTPVYNDPIYTGGPVYTYPTNPIYTTPSPVYTYPTPTYPSNPIYTYPTPTYPTPTYPVYPTPVTPPAPTKIYCAINGQYYNSQSEYNNYCKALEVRIYCAINGQYYNSQATYDANCKNVVNLYCTLNGQTYNSQQSYADGCKKYCSVNGYYYNTQSDFDNYCKAPVVSIYCSINGQYYSSQVAYDTYCKNTVTTYYCTINGQTYHNVNDYNNYCKNTTVNLYCALNGQTYNSQDAYNTGCRLYCTYNGYYYTTQNEYNNLCKAPISLYCALNGSTYSSNESYAAGCKKYCSVNGYYYTTENYYNNYCKAPTQNYYCSINGQTYNNIYDFNNYCKNIIVNNHRVVTTIPTQITKTSARCNGVGMITNNINTNGYFEYGTTQSLGYTTNSGFIGNQMSTQYSNMITGLKPNTTYYCRAVIVNANGTYKGELMSFRTASEYIKYIPTVATTKKVVTYVKNKTVTKIDKGGMDITCQDVDGNKDIIKAGDKLATIKIENVNDKVTKGSVVNYKVTYKNTSELTLSNVIVKITAPKDMTFTDKNIGEYDAIENSITLEDARVRTDETVEKIISLKINDEVVVGKSLIVNSYLSYEILDTKGETLKDEVTNYVISTVTSVDTAVDSDTKDGADNKNTNSVMPNTLLEWVAVVVLIMLLFILARFIINDVKSIKGGNSHDDDGHGNNVNH